jgi:hypothetical protein
MPADLAEDGHGRGGTGATGGAAQHSRRWEATVTTTTQAAGVLDAYTQAGGFHMNVNVLDRASLQDAMEHPESYPDVISRTFRGAL